jgi:hypothetical protein
VQALRDFLLERASQCLPPGVLRVSPLPRRNPL